jgi:hypothetical protein
VSLSGMPARRRFSLLMLASVREEVGGTSLTGAQTCR